MQEIKYDSIGTTYNETRRADPYLAGRLWDLLEPANDKLYLDIGCGTGNYTVALAQKGANFTGIDPSEIMLAKARPRNPEMKWLPGTAEKIPIDDETVAGVMATLTVHHWTSLDTAFAEIHRVLSPHGRMVIFTSTPEQMNGYWLHHYFPQMLYASVIQMPSLADITQSAAVSGFEVIYTENYFIQDDLQDHFLYVGKNRPALYLNEKMRNGISSFTSLSNKAEVEQGLRALKQDIQDNSFDEIRRTYENDLGDYVFIVLEKIDHP